MSGTKEPKTSVVHGFESWCLTSKTVEAYVTRTGGHLAPVVFDRTGRKIQPFSIAPWHSEKFTEPIPMWHRVFRGDFFCLPFGLNYAAYKGEKHGTHGEVSNDPWNFEKITEENGRHTLHLSMDVKVRPGRVDKHISLVDGHNAVYCKHVISGMEGPMPLGHHAMLQLPEKEGNAHISTSPMIHRQVFLDGELHPGEVSYSDFKPGAVAESLEKIPALKGGFVDASRYPARPGKDDVVFSINAQDGEFGWSAASIPELGYVWFGIKDPKVLCAMNLWQSNGGHLLPPWNGNHLNRIALEEMTGYFHYGLAESAEPNALSKRGITTAHILSKKKPFAVNYIMGVALAPKGFDKVKTIEPGADGTVLLTSENGKTIQQALYIGFLKTDA